MNQSETPKKDPKHHIVAQRDTRAIPAQMVLQEAGINRFTDPANLVVLPQFYHSRIHSEYYYDYVNHVITTAWDANGTEGVYDALLTLRLDIWSGTLW